VACEQPEAKEQTKNKAAKKEVCFPQRNVPTEFSTSPAEKSVENCDFVFFKA
jgi:hypothetical protein